MTETRTDLSKSQRSYRLHKLNKLITSHKFTEVYTQWGMAKIMNLQFMATHGDMSSATWQVIANILHIKRRK